MKRVIAGLIVVHRYLGVAFCLIFLVWFASGIVMVFKRLPDTRRRSGSHGCRRSTRPPSR